MSQTDHVLCGPLMYFCKEALPFRTVSIKAMQWDPWSNLAIRARPVFKRVFGLRSSSVLGYDLGCGIGPLALVWCW